MGVCSALINYNDGTQGICNVVKNAGLNIGALTISTSVSMDKKRISLMVYKQSEKGKNRRTILRGLSKWWLDAEKDKEGGDSYSAGSY